MAGAHRRQGVLDLHQLPRRAARHRDPFKVILTVSLRRERESWDLKVVREKEYWLSPIAELDGYLAGRRLRFLSSGGGKSWANLLPPWEEEMKQEGEGICLAGPNRLLYDARRWILASYTVLASSYQLSLLPSPRVAKLSTAISFSRRVYRVYV